LKHVEDLNKHIIKESVRQVGYVPGKFSVLREKPLIMHN